MKFGEWKIDPMDPAFKLDSKSGAFTATFSDPGEGKSKEYSITVTANGTDGKTIDSKPFKFTVQSCGGGSVKFIHPLPGSRVTSIFTGNSPRQDIPRSKPHRGIDLGYGGGVCKDVLASADGYVIRCGEMTGAGLGIVMLHKNSSGAEVATTKYFHLAKLYVSADPGKLISAGTPIGLEGGSGANGPNTYTPHLHFEIWKGNCVQPVDPEDYISGGLTFKSGVHPNNPNGATTTIDGEEVKNNKSTEMTSSAASSTCSGYQTPPTDGSVNGSDGTTNGDPTNGAKPNQQDVIKRINSVCDKHSWMDGEDRKFILTVAKIESNYDPKAANPRSSALGLYQFLNSLASHYGLNSYEQRVNVETATEAMIKFYKNEILMYYESWTSSGKRKIKGLPISPTAHSNRYPGLSKVVWCYGLIHHDGVGNAVKGVDKQGVSYIERRLKEFN